MLIEFFQHHSPSSEYCLEFDQILAQTQLYHLNHAPTTYTLPKIVLTKFEKLGVRKFSRVHVQCTSIAHLTSHSHAVQCLNPTPLGCKLRERLILNPVNPVLKSQPLKCGENRNHGKFIQKQVQILSIHIKSAIFQPKHGPNSKIRNSRKLRETPNSGQ